MASATPLPTTTDIPAGYDYMVVDAATQQVFVSSKAGNTVTVLSFAGQIEATIGGESGAAGMTLIGSNLYVVASTAGAIDVISTSTLTRTSTLATGLVNSDGVVVADGLLWVEDGGYLASVSPVSGALAVSTVGGTPQLVADPANSNVFFGVGSGSDPGGATRYLVSSGTVSVAQAINFFSPEVDNLGDIAVSPDGTHLVPAGGYPYQFDEFNTSNLTPSGVIYPANPYPTAAAMTAGNGGLFAGGMNGIYDPDVVVYGLDNPSNQLLSYDFGSTSETTLDHGLAFSPDGTRLFAVTGGTGNFDEFHVFRLLSATTLNQWAAASSVTVEPSSVPANGSTTSTVQVTILDQSSQPVAGETVTLSLTGSARTTGNDSAVTNSSGVATFDVADPEAETVTATAADVTTGFTVTQRGTIDFTPDPASSSLSTLQFSPPSTGVGGSVVGTVTLVDAAGAPVAGRGMTLQANRSGVVSPSKIVTASNGAATFSVTDPVAEPVTIVATDSSGTDITATVMFLPTVAVSNPGNQRSASGTPLTLDLTASDITYPVMGWTATGLPAGLSIDPTTGAITGTPTTASNGTVTVTAEDQAGFTGSTSFTWNVFNVVTVPTPGPQTINSGSAVSLQMEATDSSPVASIASWSALGLPSGVQIDSTTGIISGTPTVPGTYDVWIQATDTASYSGAAWSVWTVVSGLTVTSAPAQGSWVNYPTAVAVTTQDVLPNATRTYSATNLPPGLQISASTGAITGTVRTAGTYHPTIVVSDGTYTVSQQVAWTVQQPIRLSVPGTVRIAAGRLVILGVHGTDLAGSALHAGLSGLAPGLTVHPERTPLSQVTAFLFGVPTTKGTYHVVMTATDPYSRATTTFTIVVG